MNTSDQTYKELAIPYFKEVFELIDDAMAKKGIQYYLVGVSAMTLELLKRGGKPTRGTNDIDFAIMVSTMSEYNDIMQELEQHGFNKLKAPFSLYHQQYNTVVDLLPFGEIEENDKEALNDLYSDLHILGFQEVLEDAQEVGIEERIARIPTIHGMVLLKLIAWGDRPEERDSDLGDILKIIELYYELYWQDILENHFDLLESLESIDIDPLRIASRVLGRKAKSYLAKSQKLQARVFNLLEENLKDASTSAIAKEWARLKGLDVTDAYNILQELKTGLTE